MFKFKLPMRFTRTWIAAMESAVGVCLIWVLAVGCVGLFELPTPNPNESTFDDSASGDDSGASTYTRPLSFFAVHGDPQNADLPHFQALQQIVEAASSRGVKLSIQLTPQWVEMILAPGNEWMFDAFQSWLRDGHDYGGHHHQITHDAAWDGYSNDPATISSTRNPGYLGTLEDHLAVVRRLVEPATITNYSGGEPDDYPVGIPVLFRGGQTEGTEAAARQPERIDYGGQQAWMFSMASLTIFGQPDNDALENLYRETLPGNFFGVATHPDNWLASQTPIIAWFDFLQQQDPDGRHMRTLTEALAELPPLE